MFIQVENLHPTDTDIVYVTSVFNPKAPSLRIVGRRVIATEAIVDIYNNRRAENDAMVLF